MDEGGVHGKIRGGESVRKIVIVFHFRSLREKGAVFEPDSGEFWPRILGRIEKKESETSINLVTTEYDNFTCVY